MIRNFLTKQANAALQTDGSPSYSGERKKAIDNITHATEYPARVGIVAVAIFAVISALIIFNTIQMAIFNRRDEIQIERLLGASTWFIRGPFVVESILYGILSAIIIGAAYQFGVRGRQFGAAGQQPGLLDIAYAKNTSIRTSGALAYANGGWYPDRSRLVCDCDPAVSQIQNHLKIQSRKTDTALAHRAGGM